MIESLAAAGFIPKCKKGGRRFAAGCIEGLCSLALKGQKSGCPLTAVHFPPDIVILRQRLSILVICQVFFLKKFIVFS